MKGSTGVLEVLAALDSGKEEVLIGGFRKNPPKQSLEEILRPGKNKTPRRPKNPLEELSLVTVPEEQAQVEVARPPKINEVKDNMENEKNSVAEARLQFELCPLCGCMSKSVRTADNGDKIPYLVCKGCNDKYQAYVKKAVAQLVAGGKQKVLSKAQWILQNLDIGRFERELEAARSKRINPEKRLVELIHQLSEGQNLDPEGVAELKLQCQEKVSQEAQREYFAIKRLNSRLQTVLKFKGDLERIIAEAAAKAATAEAVPATPTALLVAPEHTVVP